MKMLSGIFSTYKKLIVIGSILKMISLPRLTPLSQLNLDNILQSYFWDAAANNRCKKYCPAT